MTTRSSTCDVVVVGARCSGAATAMLLARQGHNVIVVDRARFPSDTLSTHGLARGAVVQLSRWGLLEDVLASGAPPVRHVTFRVGEVEDTRVVKDRAGVDLLVAPRRFVLDRILADAASAAGADVRFGVTATKLLYDSSGRVAGIETQDGMGRTSKISSRLVVAADGLHSRIARAVNAEVLEENSTDNSIFYAYFEGIPWRGYEFHVGHRALAGIFPTHDTQACVWLCSPSATAGRLAVAAEKRVPAFMTLLQSVSPSLTARLREGRCVSPVRGAVNLPNIVRKAHGPGWALVGDAGYHRDAVTGLGITDAFRDAELLAYQVDRILSSDEPEHAVMQSFQRERDSQLRETFDLTCSLSAYPQEGSFVELQKRLAKAIDTQAGFLASLPAWHTPHKEGPFPAKVRQR